MRAVNSSRPRIGELLLAAGAIDQVQLATALAEQAGVAFAQPPLPSSQPSLLAKVSIAQVRQLGILPLSISMTGTVRVAVADPTDTQGQLLISKAMGAALSLTVCPADALDAAIVAAYAAAEVVTQTPIEALPDHEEDFEGEELEIIGVEDLVPEVDEDAEERIVEIAVASIRVSNLPPLATVPPGSSLGAGLHAPPIVHAAPPDLDEEEDDAATDPSEASEDDRPEEIVVELGPASSPTIAVPELSRQPRLAPPPQRTATAFSPPPPLAPLAPPSIRSFADDSLRNSVTVTSMPVTAPPVPSTRSPLDEETIPTFKRTVEESAGTAVAGLPPSLKALEPARMPPVPIGDESAPPHGLTTPLDLDLFSDRGLAVVVKELRGELSPDTTLKLLAALLARGLQLRCDAVQLAAEGSQLRVDYRVDGTMQLAVRLPDWSRAAALDAIWRAVGVPPEAPATAIVGRGFEATWQGRPVRCRITSAVGAPEMRLLLRIRDSGSVQDLDALGLPPDVRNRIRQWSAARQGVFLVVGPADSGRSTTLRAIARAESKKRRTAVVGPWDLFVSDGTETHRYGGGPREEAVAVAVHAALVQDPDVLVVDGVEDVVELVLRAAEDGRLVVAGVTADDATEALDILLERVSENLLGPQLLGIVEQRMIRGLCPSCRSTAPVDRGLARSLGLVSDTMPSTLPSRGPGCRSCRHTGVRGRHALFTRVELSSGLPSGYAKATRRLKLLVESNRPESRAEAGLSLVVQGKCSLHDLGRTLGMEPTKGDRVVVTSPKWSGTIEDTQEGPIPKLGGFWNQSLDDESTEADEPRMLPDLPGEDSKPSGEFLGPPMSSLGQDATAPRLLLVLGGDGLDDRLRKALPASEFRVASVADVAAAKEFVHRTAPRAILLSVAGDVAGTVAQVGVLREDLASAFLPLLAVGAVDDDAAILVRAGADETIAPGIKGAELETQVREAILRAT
jgi:type II secretory ATPase GspE/PulE/Tfp pilus assembly ATPase PilB-like protein